MTILCFCLAWGLIICAAIRTYKTIFKAKNYVCRLHQIPCSQCRYFTGDYRLKCTVNPYWALSEDAIGCCDFESTMQALTQPECLRAEPGPLTPEQGLLTAELELGFEL